MIQLSLPMRVRPRPARCRSERAELADQVAVADLQPRRLAAVFLVLRLSAERAVGKDAVVLPMRVRPSITTCAPMVVPSPISTCSPMMEYGPTDTPAASFAPVDDRARVDHAGPQRCRAASPRPRARRRPALAQRIQQLPSDAVGGHLDQELVAGNDRALEARAVDPDEVVDRLVVGLLPRAQNASTAAAWAAASTTSTPGITAAAGSGR